MDRIIAHEGGRDMAFLRLGRAAGSPFGRTPRRLPRPRLDHAARARTSLRVRYDRTTAIPYVRPLAVLGVAPETAERVRGHTLAAATLVRYTVAFWTKELSDAGIKDRSSRFRRRSRYGQAA